MKKSEIVKRANTKCKHGHNGLTHPKCYDEVFGEKVGFLDIESSNLKANFGICYSYCIKIQGSDEVIKRCVTPKEMKNHTYDKRLMQDLVKDLEKFDRVVTYYGSRFDIPFLRTRCLLQKVEGFPVYKALNHTDLYFSVRGKLCLHRKSLQVVAEALEIDAKNHPMHFGVWMKASGGDKKALDYILTHNIEDVITTEKVYDKMNKFFRITDTSV